MVNLLKKKARMKVNNLIRHGKLRRNLFCLRCFEKKRTYAHHPDYAKPLVVEWLCQDCHDKEHYDDRYRETQKRRKFFQPCQCGKKATCRQMCKGCYARWRKKNMTIKCVVPNCEMVQHMRGLCAKHRQQPHIFRIHALPKKRPGPVPT